MAFEKNVFINCPFDDRYKELLRPMLFTIIYCGLVPRIASEQFDSSEIRIKKILDLIEDSKFSIHDLSRIESNSKKEIARLNMPFELGLDYGCKMFKDGIWKEKKILILEKENYRYQKAISDLSGCDIKQHNDDPFELVFAMRNWIRETIKKRVESASTISDKFNEFMSDFYTKRGNEGYKDLDLKMMPMPEFIDFVKDWVKGNWG